MESVKKFIEERLKLKVNQSKSSVGELAGQKFLGFGFYIKEDKVEICVHHRSLKKIKTKIRTQTKRSNGLSIEGRIGRLSSIIRGWVNYFSIANMRGNCQTLDGWMRRRLRMCIWKQWKKVRTRFRNLMKLGIKRAKAWMYANTRKGHWRTSGSPILSTSLTNAYFNNLGLVCFSKVYNEVLNSTNRRMPNGTYGGVRGRVGN